jgi:Fur family transcriptional regulator, ferric uptake regulator
LHAGEVPYILLCYNENDYQFQEEAMKRSHLPVSDEWLERLQASGYRLTGPRRVLVELISENTHALDPLDLYDLARREYPGLGLVTVYRTLEKLEELGLVQRVHQPGGCQAYLHAAHGHEHLLICTSCGQAVYFSGDELDGLIAKVAGQSGFQIEGHWLQLFGRCARCQAASQLAA